MNGNEDRSEIQLYQAFANLSIHSQENRWQAFTGFLLFNSFLILGWTGLSSNSGDGWSAAAQIVLCLLGIGGFFLWRSLGEDYADALGLMASVATSIEQADTFPWSRKPFTERKRQLDQRPWWQKGRFLMRYMSSALGAAYIVLILLTIMSCSKSDNGQHLSNDVKGQPLDTVLLPRASISLQFHRAA